MSTDSFEGAAARSMVQAGINEMVHDVAAQAEAEWHDGLDVHIRNPTPYYETQINVDQRGERASVNDRGVVYGPWLEGTGSRNATTRFKGYAQARAATQRVESRVVDLCANALARLVRRLNG